MAVRGEDLTGEPMAGLGGVAGPLPGAGNANRSWRIWVTRHPIGASLLAGFVATHVATVIGYWMEGIGLPQLNWPVVNGNVVLPKASAVAKYVVGEVFIHGMDGVVFTLIYAVVLYPMLIRLMGSRINPLTNMACALIFGLVLGTISNGFLNPYVYFAHQGAGIFTTGFGWKVPFAVYLWHVAFGVNLGMMYNPMSPKDPEFHRRGGAVGTPAASQSPTPEVTVSGKA